MNFKHCYKLTIAYDGSAYFGWQRQAEGLRQSTVQEEIEKSLQQIGLSEFSFHGSSRTDTGVHARAITAHLRTNSEMPEDKLYRAINSQLPKDIRLIELDLAAENFNAQRDALSKEYNYFILHGTKGNQGTTWPFLHSWTWYIPQKLDYERMQAAMDILKGEHDFSSFQNTGTELANTVRHLNQFQLHIHPPEQSQFPWMPSPESGLQLLEFRLAGNAFLKQMVRNLVGLVVEVGKGRCELEQVREILAAKDRTQSAATAPAYGLFLKQVHYR